MQSYITVLVSLIGMVINVMHKHPEITLSFQGKTVNISQTLLSQFRDFALETAKKGSSSERVMDNIRTDVAPVHEIVELAKQWKPEHEMTRHTLYLGSTEENVDIITTNWKQLDRGVYDTQSMDKSFSESRNEWTVKGSIFLERCGFGELLPTLENHTLLDGFVIENLYIKVLDPANPDTYSITPLPVTAISDREDPSIYPTAMSMAPPFYEVSGRLDPHLREMHVVLRSALGEIVGFDFTVQILK